MEALGSGRAVEWAHSEMHQPSVFSETKRFLTGEGGMVLFRDEKIYLQAKILRDHGMSEISVTGTSLWVITTGLLICRLRWCRSDGEI